MDWHGKSLKEVTFTNGQRSQSLPSFCHFSKLLFRVPLLLTFIAASLFLILSLHPPFVVNCYFILPLCVFFNESYFPCLSYCSPCSVLGEIIFHFLLNYFSVPPGLTLKMLKICLKMFEKLPYIVVILIQHRHSTLSTSSSAVSLM